MTCEQVCGECPRVPLGTALVPAAGGGADVLIWGWRRLYQLTRPSCPTLYCIRSIIPSPQGSTVAPSVYTTPILPTPTLRLNEAGATAGRGASYLPAPGSYVRVGYRQVQAGQAGRRSVLLTACCLHLLASPYVAGVVIDRVCMLWSSGTVHQCRSYAPIVTLRALSKQIRTQ